MNLNLEMLKKFNTCEEMKEWYIKNNQPETVEKCSKMLIATNEEEKLRWCSWLLTHVFKKEQNIMYANFAAARAADALAAAARAADAADAADADINYNEMLIKILKYGLTLIS